MMTLSKRRAVEHAADVLVQSLGLSAAITVAARRRLTLNTDAAAFWQHVTFALAARGDVC